MTETTASVFQSISGDGIDVVSETVGYIMDHTEAKVTVIFILNYLKADDDQKPNQPSEYK